MDSGKVNILKYLKALFPNIQADYYIEKYTPMGTLEYRYITDMADPKRRIDFEFVNAFWHNADRFSYTQHRDANLKRDGWKIIKIKAKVPRPSHIRESLNGLGY